MQRPPGNPGGFLRRARGERERGIWCRELGIMGHGSWDSTIFAVYSVLVYRFSTFLGVSFDLVENYGQITLSMESEGLK